jgi:transcriptional regulator with XRE-family HTH domain
VRLGRSSDRLATIGAQGESEFVQISREVLGGVIRRARLNAKLTRSQLQRATRGRFTPTAIGGYERGERAISVVRFVELSYAIGIAPEELLAQVLDDASPRARRPLTIDLTRLHGTEPTVRDAVAGFAQHMKVRRSDFLTDVLTLRAGDLVVVANQAHVSPGELMRSIAPAIVAEPGRNGDDSRD